MAVATTLSQLEAVQAAISEILTNGQSYALGARELTRANLKWLDEREQTLLNRYYTETQGRAVNKVRFDRPGSGSG